jgi:outer membrane biosynthesis protein TonB
MPVSPDQRALLELILQRGNGYGDIAELLGIDVEQARERAHRVLEELAGTDPDARAEVSDFLLGQLEPGEREEVEGVLRRDPELLDLASELSAKLRLLVPRGQLPALPDPREEPKPKAVAPPQPKAAEPPKAPQQPPQPKAAERRPKAPQQQPKPAPAAPPRPKRDRRRPVERTPTPWERLRSAGRVPRIAAGGLAVALLAVIVVIALVAGGGDDGNDTSSTRDTATETANPTPAVPEVQVIPLARSSAAPAGAKGRSGIAPTKDGAVLEYQATGLDPTQGRQRYVVWFFNTRKAAVPLTEGRKVGEDGKLSGLAKIPPAVVNVLPQTRFVDISLEPSRPKRGSTTYKGKSILRGALP